MLNLLDNTNEHIFVELAKHARATCTEIRQQVNLSAPAVKRCVDRILEKDVTKDFTTSVNRNTLDCNTQADDIWFLPQQDCSRSVADSVGEYPPMVNSIADGYRNV